MKLNLICLQSMAELADRLLEIYRTLGYPSAKVFYKELKKQKFDIRLKDAEDFVKNQSVRQIIGKPPTLNGSVVAFDVNHRWAADVADFSTRAIKTNSGIFTCVLFVQDIFSRFLYTTAMTGVGQTTDSFIEILKASQDKMNDTNSIPHRLDTDAGSEFTSNKFKAMCKRFKIELVIGDKQDKTKIPTVDNAISQIKRALERIRMAENGNWYVHLERATDAYNSSSHSGIRGAEPASLTDDDIFSLRKEASLKLVDNTIKLTRRKQKLERLGHYRVQTDKPEGLKRRTDAERWSEEIHVVKDFPAPGIVEDTKGRRTLTKLTRPVQGDSEAVIPRPVPPIDDLEEYAIALSNITPSTGLGTPQASKKLKSASPGAMIAIKNAKLKFMQFVEKFPDHLRIQNKRIFSTRQTVL